MYRSRWNVGGVSTSLVRTVADRGRNRSPRHDRGPEFAPERRTSPPRRRHLVSDGANKIPNRDARVHRYRVAVRFRVPV